MNEVRKIVVYGIAQPQGSKSAFVVQRSGQRARAVMREGTSIEARDRHRSWRDAVAEAARAWCAAHPEAAPLDVPVRLYAEFFLPRPASKKRAVFPAGKPDLSKLVRAVEDSLSGLLYVDDARIVVLACRKRYCEGDVPRAEVEVSSAADWERY